MRLGCMEGSVARSGESLVGCVRSLFWAGFASITRSKLLDGLGELWTGTGWEGYKDGTFSVARFLLGRLRFALEDARDVVQPARPGFDNRIWQIKNRLQGGRRNLAKLFGLLYSDFSCKFERDRTQAG